MLTRPTTNASTSRAGLKQDENALPSDRTPFESTVFQRGTHVGAVFSRLQNEANGGHSVSMRLRNGLEGSCDIKRKAPTHVPHATLPARSFQGTKAPSAASLAGTVLGGVKAHEVQNRWITANLPAPEARDLAYLAAQGTPWTGEGGPPAVARPLCRVRRAYQERHICQSRKLTLCWNLTLAAGVLVTVCSATESCRGVGEDALTEPRWSSAESTQM